MYFISLYIIYDWINIMGYSKQESSTINMLYPHKKNLSYDSPYLPTMATSPERPLSSAPKVAIVERFDVNKPIPPGGIIEDLRYFITCKFFTLATIIL